MRSLSGYSDVPLALILAGALSCAPAPPASSPSEHFELTGTLSIEGTQPFDRDIFLVDMQGNRWILDPGGLEAELRLLDGYDVALTCSGVGGRNSERDAEVQSYMLIPPDGMNAFLGTVSVSADSVFLAADGSRYRLEGPLSAALKLFEDNRSWVWGRIVGQDGLEVGGYEIIGR